MPQSDLPTEPSVASTTEFYHSLRTVYSNDDRWHQVSHQAIARFVTSHARQLSSAESVLNVGSAGINYCLPEPITTHLDVHSYGFNPAQRLVLGDAHAMPFADASFDACLCVGSVLNHCDAAKVIAELGRVTDFKGFCFIEFETSHSLELIGTPAFGKAAWVIETFYQQRSISLWAYRESFVRGLLATSGFTILARASYHHLSPLMYRLGWSPNTAASAALLDPLLARLPGLRRYASNVIYLCQRHE